LLRSIPIQAVLNLLHEGLEAGISARCDELDLFDVHPLGGESEAVGQPLEAESRLRWRPLEVLENRGLQLPGQVLGPHDRRPVGLEETCQPEPHHDAE
jgi:hypothetical protein